MKKRTKIIIFLIIIATIVIKLDLFGKKQTEVSKIDIIETNNSKPKTKEENIIVKDAETKKEEVEKPVVYNCPTPKKEYTDMILFNIGQTTGLEDKTYIPKDLKELSLNEGTRKELCLVKEAEEALSLMIEKANKDKIKIKASSAFRSYSTQKIIYENDLKNKGLENSNSVAKPGYSEHQLGTTVDITGASINYLSASDKFDGTKEDLWLKENAYLYGFIQSYPYQKEDITGYRYEPWHYRYVGKDIAKKIKELDITITEFLNLQ